MPNLCAEDGKDAVSFCISTPSAVNVSYLIEQVNGLATLDLIDAVANVAGDKVFIYHGTEDTNILPGTDTLSSKKYTLSFNKKIF